MTRIFLFVFVSVLLVSCKRPKPVTDPRDYSIFLNSRFLEKERNRNERETAFWHQKWQTDTGSYINKLEIAFQLLTRFKLNGNVQDVLAADSLFRSSAAALNYSNPEIFYSLAQNAITQHRFRDAFGYTIRAGETGGAVYTTNQLHFDAAMELGMYASAQTKLEQLTDKEAVDYLIRRAKLEDHNGNLDKAIFLMEKALAKVSRLNKKTAYRWVLSNLGDMYGHAGRIEDSYRAYLDVLKTDSSDLYCLKGIAWIAYAHDKNIREAERILRYIQSQTQMPDVLLLLAEIADYEKREAEKKDLLRQFIQQASRPAYGAMYNLYLVDIYTSDIPDYEKALSISLTETESRPTPETFHWLAWVYFKKGDLAKADEIIRHYVVNETHEPDAWLHAAYIKYARGEKTEAMKLFKDCLESAYELGPVKAGEIHALLNNE